MLRLRSAVRAVILDEDDRVLLCRLEFTEAGGDVTVWTVPGGGVERGEDQMTALRRELDEEVGLELAADPPHVWHQEVVVPNRDDGTDGVRNDYYLVRTQVFEPRGSMTDEQLTQESLMGFRWWTLAELAAYDGPALFAPRAFPVLFRALLADGVPQTPVLLGL